MLFCSYRARIVLLLAFCLPKNASRLILNDLFKQNVA